MMGFDEWVADVNGKSVGPNDTHGQCVGLYYDYCTRVLGVEPVSTQYGPHAGYAIGTWDSNKPPAGLVAIKGATDIRKKDIIFWNWGYPFTPLSHVAIAAGTATGGMVNVCSQNSPLPFAVLQPLPTLGIAGVWRPANSTESKSPDPLGITQSGEAASILSRVGGLNTLLSTLAGTNPAVPNLWPRVGLFLLGCIILAIALFNLISGTAVSGAITKAVKHG
jgi:hypothetical protein